MFKKLFILVFAVALLFGGAAKAYAQYTFDLGLWAQPGAQAGTVLLSWNDNDVITNYNVAYGTTPGNYQYGAVGIGNTGSYVVGGLTPGVTYYFALSPVVNGQGLGYLPGVSAKAAGVTTASPKNNVTQATVTAPLGGPGNDGYQLRAVSGPGKGQVSLNWQNPYGAQQWDVVYGTQAGNYTMGAQNVGHNSSQVTISGLTSGVTYIFTILGENGSTTVGSFAAPVAQVAM